jgi:hypothetical protein
MGIDDRLRNGLRRSAARVSDAEPAVEHLWSGIEQGVIWARRRQTTTRIAAATVSLVVVAGAIALVALAFRGSRHEPGSQRANLAVHDVQVFGVPNGIAKIYGTVSNRGSGPAGASISCAVLDISGKTLGTATGSVSYVGPGDSLRFGPLAGEFSTSPRSARCTATATPAVTPSPSPVGGASFRPLGIVFWDGRRGLMTGVFGEPECSPDCTWVIEFTEDGGQTWHEVERSRAAIFDVTLLPPPSLSGCGFGCGVPVGRASWAWALRGPCAMGTCTIDVLYSGDGGHTWVKRATTALKDISFVSARDGWGVGDVFANGQRLASTADGGQTWQSHAVPCPQAAATAIDMSFVSRLRGWLLCTGVGAAGNENRGVLETTDGGATWITVAQGMLGGPSTGGFTVAGYPTGIFFLSDGHGWMWSNRAVGLLATDNGGRSWHVVGHVPNGASTSIGSIWFLTDTSGFALLTNGDAQATQLIQTSDGGHTWHIVHSWPT